MPSNEPAETALGRGIRIIDFIAEKKTARFTELKNLLGNVSPSLLTRLLAILIEMGVIRKNSENLYTMSDKVKTWGAGASMLKDLAGPLMGELKKKLGVTVILFELSGKDALVCTEKFADEHSPGMMTIGGTRELPTIHGLGGPFFMSDEQIETSPLWKKELGGAKYGMLNSLKESFRCAKREGIHSEIGLIKEDTARFSAPITVNGKAVAVIGVGTTPSRCKNREFVEQVKNELLSISKKLSKQMNGENNKTSN
jgi:DNA-binding IclR family transcriptional regulator